MHTIRWQRSACLAILIVGAGTAFHEVEQARSTDPPDSVPRQMISLDEMVSLEEVFTRLAEEVGPSVVAIRVTRRLDSAHRSADSPQAGGDVTINQAPEHPVSSAGSGVVLRADGRILTNQHVIAAADEITVLLHDGSRCPATLVASDVRSDLAVLRVDRNDLKPARLGDLSDVHRGQWAFALGDPYGFAADGHVAISVGHISALGRALQRQLDPTNVRYYGNLIQTTADINPGNSGGPLLNLQGEVVGINTAIQTRTGSNEGVGFAVPISERTRQIIDHLLEGEPAEYGYLGVHVRAPTPAERREAGITGALGALVTAIEPETPAAAAGLRVGDIITEYEGTPTDGADHLVRLVGMTRCNREVVVRYYRAGRLCTARAVVARRYVPAQDHDRGASVHQAAPGQGDA
ncbi:MAG: trypsin-like peptidase domain-containing protein [Phycisphaerales bacterium]|nr:MAG: trypsin-like peptidase domain-containing protein [Phycisphaerales bacterium]